MASEGLVASFKLFCLLIISTISNGLVGITEPVSSFLVDVSISISSNKYSAFWCPNCLNQSELFGKQAYRELNVVECARDGINSQTQLCIDKKIKGFPTWEINGKLILGVLSLKELSKLTGFKN